MTRILITDLKSVYSALNIYVVFILLLVEDDVLRVYQRHAISSIYFGVPIEVSK